MLVSFNGIDTLYYSNILAEYLDNCPLYSFPNKLQEYKKHEQYIDTYLDIGRDVVINNNYFSILVYSSDILSYKCLQNRVSTLSILPKLKTLAFFIVSKDVEKTLQVYSPFKKEVTNLEKAKRINNEYKKIYLVYSYIYNINPILIEVNPNDPKHISKTVSKIKYIVAKYKRNCSFEK